MIRIQQIKLPIDHDNKALEKELSDKVRSIISRELRSGSFKADMVIRRRSIDARKKPELYYVYTVDVSLDKKSEDNLVHKLENRTKTHSANSNISFVNDEDYVVPKPSGMPEKSPVIVGSGPAGLFAAYILALAGFNPIVLERGEKCDARFKRVKDFWENKAPLNTESNVQFGEGGAGTFSDGKLNTMVKDKAGRNRFVLETFARFGAPSEITYVAKPHLGTDRLSQIIPNLRNEIIRLGGTFLFSCRLSDINTDNGSVKSVCFINSGDEETLSDGRIIKKGENELDTDRVILAIGHSARDTFKMLYDNGIKMEQKNFAVGLRMEHPQEDINLSQYGRNDDALPAADYKLTYNTSKGRGVYSFCMCPGGYVVNASSEEGYLAVNGMSYSGRNSDNANAAIVVTISGKDFDSDHPLSGLDFQRKLEKKAFELGNGRIPVQRYEDYAGNISSNTFGSIEPMMKGDYSFTNLRELFNDDINDAIIEAIPVFARSIKGYDNPDAILSGVESRTSSPVRIVRDENYMANVTGLYPCGEGAGYAGGITSAAMDGMKVAEAIIKEY